MLNLYKTAHSRISFSLSLTLVSGFQDQTLLTLWPTKIYYESAKIENDDEVNQLTQENFHIHTVDTMTNDLHRQGTADKHNALHKTLGFHHSVTEVSDLLCHYTALVGSCLVLFCDSLSVPY
jgi:hypothetical protein